jgi:hypothetical protein
MKQKKIINVLIVIGASAIMLILWFNGFAYLYAQILKLGANILLIFSSNLLKMPRHSLSTLSLMGERGPIRRKPILFYSRSL